MNYEIETINNINIAVFCGEEKAIYDLDSGLDFLMTAWHETQCNRVVINKKAVDESFFDLKTKLLGEFLQKAVTYQTKIAFYGDFENYDSKALKDFIYECNRGKDIFFGKTEKEAVDLISQAK